MKTLTQTPKKEKATSGQITLLTRIIGDIATSDPVQLALKGLDKAGAERLKGNPKFATNLRRYVLEQINELSATDKYKAEEEKSSYGYLSGYKGDPTLPQNLHELEGELIMLRKLFPELESADYDRELCERIRTGAIRLPAGAERWTLIPRFEKVAPTYSAAVQKVLDLIDTARGGAFHNYRKGQITEERLRQSEESVAYWKKLGDEQKGDFLIVPVQLGLRHRGRSVRRAIECFQANEFGLGAFAVGITILTHPERLNHYDDLWLDASGDEFDDPGGGTRFDRAPSFWFFDGRVGFGTRFVSDARGVYGSGSGFLPQAAQQPQ